MSDYSNYQAKNCTNPLADMLIRRKLTNVEHRDGAYILKLVDMGGGYQPVRIPDSFGYEPKLGMQVIWDTDDYSPAADLSLYDESGKLLFSLYHDDKHPEDWKDAWHDTTPKKSQLKEMISSVTPPATSNETQSAFDQKEIEGLMPVCRVLANALFEIYPEPTWQSRSFEYIKAVNDYLKNPDSSKNEWAKLLGKALRDMQQRGIISAEGAITKSEEFKNDSLWQKQICRPAGAMPEDLSKTKTFNKIGSVTGSSKDKSVGPR